MQVEQAYEMLAAAAVLAKLRFPIATADELVAQLPAGGLRATFGGRTVNLRRVIHLLPAYYFPFSNLENMIAKATYFLRENEHRIGVSPAVATVAKRVADAASFPIADAAQLRRAMETAGISQVTLGERSHSVDSVLRGLRGELFPIQNASALYRISREFAPN